MTKKEYIGIISSGIELYSAYGSIPIKKTLELFNAFLAINVEDSCDTIVPLPSVLCPFSYIMRNDYMFTVGNGVNYTIYSGFYSIDIGTNMSPDFNVLDTYFNNNPFNFSNTGLFSGPVSITPPSAFYIVFKVPSDINITILDSTSLDITSTFLRFIQGSDSYYVKYTTIAPSTINLTINL